MYNVAAFHGAIPEADWAKFELTSEEAARLFDELTGNSLFSGYAAIRLFDDEDHTYCMHYNACKREDVIEMVKEWIK